VSARAAQVLPAAVARLRDAGVPDPVMDARRLLAHAMNVPFGRLTIHLEDPLTAPARAAFEAALVARGLRQPVSQIVGGRDFWGRWFRVTRDVLDPRPETETLIAAALCEPAARILDLGTGSGCILVTLLAEWSDATGLGVDVSRAALDVAAFNAKALDVSGRAAWLESCWATGVDGPFDLIVSNPPYVSSADMAALSPEVHTWEPHIALTPGGDALAAYREIIPVAAGLLAPEGRLVLEIGPTQGQAARALAQAAGLHGVQVLCDFDGRDRVIVARREPPEAPRGHCLGK